MSGVAPIPWSIHALRFTAFLEQPIEALKAYALLVGEEPSEQHRNSQQALCIERGTILGWSGEVRTQFDRVDIVVSPIAPAANGELPSIGPLDESIGTFVDQVASHWLPKLGSAKRVCFGVVGATPFETEAAATAQAASITGISLSGDVSDLFVQFNRPVTSEVVDGLRINRLCKWGVSKFVSLVIDPQAANPAQAITKQVVNFDLDFNTDGARSQPLPVGTPTPLFQELVANARATILEVKPA